MPCTDGPTDEWWISTRRETGLENGLVRAEVPAALCAILTVLERTGQLDAVMNHADWTEAGIRRVDLESWWTDHKKKDQWRREREAKR